MKTILNDAVVLGNGRAETASSVLLEGILPDS
jgi:hypothetical protein